MQVAYASFTALKSISRLRQAFPLSMSADPIFMCTHLTLYMSRCSSHRLTAEMHTFHSLKSIRMRLLIIAILLWFLFLSKLFPGPQPFFYHPKCTSRYCYALRVANTTSWRTFAPGPSWVPNWDPNWGPNRECLLDLAGFRKEDGFAWQMLETWKRKCKLVWWGSDCVRQWPNSIRVGEALREEQWEDTEGGLYGEWALYAGNGKETATQSSNTRRLALEGAPRIVSITGINGSFLLHIDGKGKEMEFELEEDVEEYEQDLGGSAVTKGISRNMALVREVTATLKVTDDSKVNTDKEMHVYGVHWPRMGQLLLTTTSEKFDGIFGLPQMAFERDYYRTSQRLLSAMIERKLSNSSMAASSDGSNPWAAISDAKRRVPQCELVAYVQMHPKESVFGEKPDEMHPNLVAERKRRCLSVASAAVLPGAKMSIVIFSPDCGVILESKGVPDLGHLPY